MGSDSQVDQALSNLEAIKSGGDPRVEPDTPQSPSALPQEPLAYEELQYKSSEYERSREEMLETFVRCVNICEPEHPYTEEPYPIRTSDVDYSYCKNSSSYNARCGPRRDISPNVVGFAVDTKRIGSRTSARLYVLFAHELTHITHGSHNDGSSHDPDFWQAFAENARTLFENRERLRESFDAEQFVTHCYYGPNTPMTDKRMRTVSEQREEVLEALTRF